MTRRRWPADPCALNYHDQVPSPFRKHIVPAKRGLSFRPSDGGHIILATDHKVGYRA